MSGLVQLRGPALLRRPARVEDEQRGDRLLLAVYGAGQGGEEEATAKSRSDGMRGGMV